MQNTIQNMNKRTKLLHKYKAKVKNEFSEQILFGPENEPKITGR